MTSFDKEFSEIIRRNRAWLISMAGLDAGATDYSLRNDLIRLVEMGDSLIPPPQIIGQPEPTCDPHFMHAEPPQAKDARISSEDLQRLMEEVAQDSILFEPIDPTTFKKFRDELAKLLPGIDVQVHWDQKIPAGGRVDLTVRITDTLDGKSSTRIFALYIGDGKLHNKATEN